MTSLEALCIPKTAGGAGRDGQVGTGPEEHWAELVWITEPSCLGNASEVQGHGAGWLDWPGERKIDDGQGKAKAEGRRVKSQSSGPGPIYLLLRLLALGPALLRGCFLHRVW